MPANTADIRLQLEDGSDLMDKINPRLISLSLTEKRGEESDALEFTLHNHDGRLAPIKKGVTLTLSLGWKAGGEGQAGLVSKGRFKVDEVERSGPPDIATVRARAADLTGKYRTRTNRIWKDMTLGSILSEIAGRNGLTAKVHADLTGIQVKAIEQGHKSDMAFVRDLGRRHDALATVKDRNLLFIPIGAETSASGKAVPALTLTRRVTQEHKGGWAWTFRAVNREEHDGAEAQYHDEKEAKRKTVKSGGSNPKRLKRVFRTKDDADQASAAAAKKAERGAFTFSYDMAFADCSIEPNKRVTLKGWDSEIDGVKWLVESVETRFDGSSGLTQSLNLESAA